MVSSVAMFGVQNAYGPLSPLYRIPMLALVSEVSRQAVVVDGEVVARPMLTVTATLDHRYLDGSHAARLGQRVRAYLEDPGAFEPCSETPPRPSDASDGAGERPWLRFYGAVPESLEYPEVRLYEAVRDQRHASRSAVAFDFLGSTADLPAS